MSKKKRQQLERKKAKLRRERDMAAHTAYAIWFASFWNDSQVGKEIGAEYHKQAVEASTKLVNMARATIKPTV